MDVYEESLLEVRSKGCFVENVLSCNTELEASVRKVPFCKLTIVELSKQVKNPIDEKWRYDCCD